MYAGQRQFTRTKQLFCKCVFYNKDRRRSKDMTKFDQLFSTKYSTRSTNRISSLRRYPIPEEERSHFERAAAAETPWWVCGLCASLMKATSRPRPLFCHWRQKLRPAVTITLVRELQATRTPLVQCSLTVSFFVFSFFVDKAECIRVELPSDLLVGTLDSLMVRRRRFWLVELVDAIDRVMWSDSVTLQALSDDLAAWTWSLRASCVRSSASSMISIETTRILLLMEVIV